MFINSPKIIPELKSIVPDAAILKFDLAFKYEVSTPVIAHIGKQKRIIIKLMFAACFISWSIPGDNSDHNKDKFMENIKAIITKIKNIKMDIWLMNFFLFWLSMELKKGIKDVDKPPPRIKLTIKSGNVRRTTAISVCSFAPEIEEINHSRVKPVILPNKIKEATTIVEFFIDNFEWISLYLIITLKYNFSNKYFI